MRVTGLMPIKGIGRKAETLELIPRLFATAGNLGRATFDLVVIADEDELLAAAVTELNHKGVTVLRNEKRRGYWNSLAYGATVTDAPLLINLANDLIPGREWLARSLRTFTKAQQTFGRDPVIGFNDGVHPGNHAGHCLFPRNVLERWYGASLFPTMYDHLHADVELVVRAMEEGRFAYSYFAILFHNHHVNGKPFDPVYQLGHARQHDDYRIFQERRANGWK